MPQTDRLFENHTRLFDYICRSRSSAITYQEKGFLESEKTNRYFYLKFSKPSAKGILCVTTERGWDFYEANENLRLNQFFRKREALESCEIYPANNQIDFAVDSQLLKKKNYPIYLYEHDIFEKILKEPI